MFGISPLAAQHLPDIYKEITLIDENISQELDWEEYQAQNNSSSGGGGGSGGVMPTLSQSIQNDADRMKAAYKEMGLDINVSQSPTTTTTTTTTTPLPNPNPGSIPTLI